MTYGLSLNTGSYFGNGISSVGGGYSAGNRTASSSNLNRVSRDIAAGYSQNMEFINLYLEQGEVDQALKLYDELMDEVKQTAGDYGYNLTDSQVATTLNNAFYSATGTKFTTAAVENTHGSFVTGLIEGLPIIGWFANGNSKAETVAKITGTEPSVKDEIKEGAGAVLSGAAAGAAIGSCIPAVGTVVGAVVGGALGLAKTIFKR